MEKRPPMLMIASPASETVKRSRAAPLWSASATVLALMPVGMAVAHRSSPVFLGVSALLALFGVFREGSGGAFVRLIGKVLDRPLGIACLLFFVFTVVSLSWSAFPSLSFSALGEFWLPAACAFLLALILPGRAPPWAPTLFAGALAAACGLILADLATDLAWRRALGLRSAAFIFNRPVLTIFAGTLPIVAFLVPRGTRAKVAAAALVVLAVLHHLPFRERCGGTRRPRRGARRRRGPRRAAGDRRRAVRFPCRHGRDRAVARRSRGASDSERRP